MSILPVNKPQKTVDTPKNFFIYGATMNGKSYLASEFPNPLFLDTDGNASANPFPSIEIRNIRDKTGKISKSVVDQIDEVIVALQVEKHTYETVIIDVIDDIIVMIETSICEDEGVSSIGDIPYGKGYAMLKSAVQQLVIELKSLPMNVIYVSRISTRLDNNVTIEEPSLPEKWVNIVNGNCDYMIQASKIGKNYIRVSKMKRKNYQRDQIEDKRILKILDTVTGAFERTRSTDKKTQDEIVKNREEAEEKAILEILEPEAPLSESGDDLESSPEVVEATPVKPNVKANEDGTLKTNRRKPKLV